MANFLKGSLQDELDQLFQSVFRLDVSKRMASRSAVCKARRKVSHSVFKDLLDVICIFLNDQAPANGFRGRRTFAIDGSTVRLPNRPAILKHFGSVKTTTGCRAMARFSILHDVYNRVTYDAILSPYNKGEHDLAWQHIEEASLPDHSLLLMDRGYTNFHLLREIMGQGHDFCVRVRNNLKVVNQLKRSGKIEGVFEFKPSSGAIHQAEGDLKLLKPIPVRVVQVDVGKQPVYLMTSILDEEITILELADLYHQRWQVEESYKVKKCRMKLEEFSGTTPECILQDVHAKIFAESLTVALTLEAASQVEDLQRKYSYKICLTQALSKMKNTLVLLFLRRTPAQLIESLTKIFYQGIVAVVPGRKAKRKISEKGGPRIIQPAFGYRLNR